MLCLSRNHLVFPAYAITLFCASLDFIMANEAEFLVVNDIHYDFTYFTRRESCLPEAPPLEDTGTYGNYDCEGGDVLLQSILDNMASTANDPKFVIWLGDNPHHSLNYSTSLLSAETVLQVQQNLTRLFQEKFPSTLVLPVIGNHDVFPRDQAPAERNDGYDALLDLWGDWIGSDEERDHFRQAGYYSRVVDDGLRVVVLNTNLYLSKNLLTEGQEDPGGQLIWFNATLGRAREQGEKILLVLHIPMGVSEASNYEYIRNISNHHLYDTIRSNGDLIIGALTAHSHNDAFKLFYDDDGAATAAIYAGGAATGYRGYWTGGNARNVAFRVGHYGPDGGNITILQDLVTYYLDIPQANAEGPVWQAEYSFREAYGIPSLAAENVAKVLDKMKDDNGVFEKFRRFYYVSVEDAEYPSCTCQCKWGFLCSAEFIRVKDFEQCYEKQSATCGAESQVMKASSLSFIVYVVTVTAIVRAWY